MFEHFTFGAQPQTRLDLDESFPSPTDTSCSPLAQPPTSYPFPPHPSNHGVNEIVAKLSQQTLQQQSRAELVKRFQAWQNDSPMELEVDYEETDSLSEQIDEIVSLPPSPKMASVSCRRLQRQLNVQLQSCSGHMRDINVLVEDMIASKSQCQITTRHPLPRSEGDASIDVFDDRIRIDDRDQDIDEGFYEGEDLNTEELETSLRRASMPSGIRKSKLHYGRSADVISIGGRFKVRSAARVRKRKMVVARTQ